MLDHYDGQKQFRLEPRDFLNKLDFINWYRYFHILRALADTAPRAILEIGPGEGAIQRVYEPFAERYETMDLNKRLGPAYVSDVRNRVTEAENRYDAVIAADILEHIPFGDLGTALANIRAYLKDDGRALITIPHRASYFFWMTPAYIPHIIRIPTGFLSWGAFYRRFIRRKIWIDPDHQWEVGDGTHTVKDVERVMRNAGFHVESRKTLLYVDFWILKK